MLFTDGQGVGEGLLNNPQTHEAMSQLHTPHQPDVWCPVVCGAAKGAAKDAAQAAFKGMVHAFGDGATAMLKFMSTFWFKIPDPHVANEGTGQLDASLMKVENNLGFIILFVGTLSFLFALGRMVWSGQMAQSGREVTRLMFIMVASTAAVGAVTQLLLTAGNAFAPWIVDQAGKGGGGDGLGTIISGSLLSGQADSMLGMWLVIYILVMLGALVQVVFMVLRGGALIVLMVLQPIFAADTASEAGFNRWKRSIGLILSFTLYKPVAAIIYAIGIALISGAPGQSEDGKVMKAIYGLTIVVLASMALPAMIKFFVPMAAGMSSSAFSGGAALGAMATGAAVVATGGAAMAGGGMAGAMGRGAAANAGGKGASAAVSNAGSGSGGGPGGPGGSSGGSGGGPGGGSGDSGSGGGGSAPRGAALPDDQGTDESSGSGEAAEGAAGGGNASSGRSGETGTAPGSGGNASQAAAAAAGGSSASGATSRRGSRGGSGRGTAPSGGSSASGSGASGDAASGSTGDTGSGGSPASGATSRGGSGSGGGSRSVSSGGAAASGSGGQGASGTPSSASGAAARGANAGGGQGRGPSRKSSTAARLAQETTRRGNEATNDLFDDGGAAASGANGNE